MSAFRRKLPWMAYLTSLLVIASALWMPTSAIGQVVPGSPFGGGGASFGLGAHTWTGAQTFTLGGVVSADNTLWIGPSTAGNAITWRINQTPDTAFLGVHTTARSWIIAEWADVNTDFAHAQEAHPALFIQSSTEASVNQFTKYSYLGASSSRNTVTVDAATTFAVTSAYIVLACTGAETINTITGGTSGMTLILENSDTECTIADDDSATAADAVDLTGTATADVGAVAKVVTLLYNGTHWLQMSESDN